jgi:hypothetical protein
VALLLGGVFMATTKALFSSLSSSFEVYYLHEFHFLQRAVEFLSLDVKQSSLKGQLCDIVMGKAPIVRGPWLCFIPEAKVPWS